MALDTAGLNRPKLIRLTAQAALVDFLLTDMDLAFMFLKIARTARRDHATDLIGRARKALSTLRHLSGRIEDASAWNTVHQRGNQLESALYAWKR